MNHNTYTKDSIKTMDPLTFCRYRPDVYCGSTADSTQLVSEIVSNAIDEHLAGNCNKVSVDIDEKDNIITVQDWGQGIIPNNAQNGKTTLEMVYGDINSSGKYDKSDNAVYKVSTGAFGIGAALTCFLSHYLTATTKRDGKFETVYFVEGKFDHREVGSCGKDEHGVTVVFQPSKEFFDNPAPNKNLLRKNAQKITCICPNLTYIFCGEEISHQNGLNDYLTEVCETGPELVQSRFLLDKTIDYRRLDFGMTVMENGGQIDAFCNYSPIESGTPVTAIKSCVTRTINKWAQERKLLKEKETLSGTALQEGMVIVFNLVSKDIRYDSQTKVRVTSTTDNPFINEVLSLALETWLDNNPQDGKVIVERALLAKRAAEAAKKAREAVKSKAEKKKDKILKMPSKLADCHCKDRSKAEIYLTEGDSASGGAKMIRDASTQAVMGLRGKVLNLLTASAEKAIKNAEIVDILNALGMDWGIVDKQIVVDYNESKLRYGKIIIASDSDPDGAHICCLLLTFFLTVCPELIRDGHVYVAIAPLYKAEWGKNSYQYINNAKDLETFKKNHKGEFSLMYFKGLGEVSPQELGAMIMDPKTRKVEQVHIEKFSDVKRCFNNLMGSDSTPKKEFVFSHQIKSQEGGVNVY